MTHKEELMKIFDDLENQKSKLEEFKKQQTVRLTDLKQLLIKNLNTAIDMSFDQFQQKGTSTTALKDARKYIAAYLDQHKGELFLSSDIVDIVRNKFAEQLSDKTVRNLISIMIDKPSKKIKILRLSLSTPYVENLINSELISSHSLAMYRRSGSVPFFTSVLQDPDMDKYNTTTKSKIEHKFHVYDKNTDKLLE